MNFPAPKETSVPLSKLLPGAIVRFTDSSKRAQTLAQAQVEPGENLFLVFTAEEESVKITSKYANLMSLDGEHVCRSQNDWLVVVQEVMSYKFSGGTLVTIESLGMGNVIIYGITEKGFVNKGFRERSEFLYVRTKETPSVTGRIPFVSLAGKKIFLDDDRIVLAVDGFVLNFK